MIRCTLNANNSQQTVVAQPNVVINKSNTSSSSSSSSSVCVCVKINVVGGKYFSFLVRHMYMTE